MSSGFEVGDVVRLKSGSPNMVITSELSKEMVPVIGGEFTTVWHNSKGNVKRSYFNAVELEYVVDE